MDILDGSSFWVCGAGEEEPPPTEVERVVRKPAHTACYACSRKPTKMPWIARVMAAFKAFFCALGTHSLMVNRRLRVETP